METPNRSKNLMSVSNVKLSEPCSTQPNDSVWGTDFKDRFDRINRTKIKASNAFAQELTSGDLYDFAVAPNYYGSTCAFMVFNNPANGFFDRFVGASV